jgi:hypothetical protein
LLLSLLAMALLPSRGEQQRLPRAAFWHALLRPAHALESAEYTLDAHTFDAECIPDARYFGSRQRQGPLLGRPQPEAGDRRLAGKCAEREPDPLSNRLQFVNHKATITEVDCKENK